MSGGLDKIIRASRVHFKSEGERRIAYFLDDNSIRYQYEPGVLITDLNEKVRLWYLDFGLLEFASFIEYFGMAGKPDYNEGIKTKLSTYKKMEMDVIPVFPWTFREDWQRYIMTELEKITLGRYNSLKEKKYWTR